MARYYYAFCYEKVRRRRQALKLTLQEIADIAGCDASSLSRVEAGKRSPSADLLGRIAGALQIHVNYFFDRKTE